MSRLSAFQKWSYVYSYLKNNLKTTRYNSATFLINYTKTDLEVY